MAELLEAYPGAQRAFFEITTSAVAPVADFGLTRLSPAFAAGMAVLIPEDVLESALGLGAG